MRTLPAAALFVTVSLAPLAVPAALPAQAPAASPAAGSRQLGTVTAIADTTLTLQTSAGPATVTVQPGAQILLLPAGRTDLKSATPAQLSDVAVGDRVLAAGTPGSAPATLAASRVVLMKSSDIAARRAAQQQDWQLHGTGGIVRGVVGTEITLASGARTLKVETSPTTIFRRYADDSVSFEDAKPSTLADIRTGDQASVRGPRAEDGTITAAEVVSGSFDNLSGSIASVDVNAQTLTLKDLATKKTVVVHFTPKSDLRALPSDVAATFAARSSAGRRSGQSGGSAPASAAAPAPQSGQQPGAEPRRSAGGDLARMLPHLPQQQLDALKPGEAVMIVASQEHGAGGPLTAITLLSGVEQLITAQASGGESITLSPWNIGVPESTGGATP